MARERNNILALERKVWGFAWETVYITKLGMRDI
jgi:hypothetical protein